MARRKWRGNWDDGFWILDFGWGDGDFLTAGTRRQQRGCGAGTTGFQIFEQEETEVTEEDAEVFWEVLICVLDLRPSGFAPVQGVTCSPIPVVLPRNSGWRPEIPAGPHPQI